MQLPDHVRICRKGCRVVPEAVPNDFDTMLSKPTNVSAEPNKRRVDVDAAHTGRAAHGRLKHFKFAHRCSHEFCLVGPDCSRVRPVMLVPLKGESLTSVKSQTMERHFAA
jgi:hypothetical protein